MSENIVFALHGFLGQAADWAIVKKNLQGQTELEAPDLLSAESPDIAEFEEYAEQLGDTVEEATIGKTKKIFVGYSLGGRLGLHLLALNPDLFDHYIFISTNPGLNENESAEKNKRLMADMKWASLITEKNWSAFLGEWNTQAVFEGSRGEPQRHASDYDLDKLKRALVMWSVSQQQDFREVMQTLQSKITWVVGDRDAKYLDLAEQLTQKKILLDFKGISSGHRVLSENPMELAKLISGHL